MGVGLPVIAFAVDGVAETVVHGESGYLVSPRNVEAVAQVIVRLAQNAPLRTQMGKKGKQRVESCFSASLTAEKVSKTIRNHLGCTQHKTHFAENSC
jgi:glycosyltransferase involved in cell wall biosynthesis